VPTATGNNVEAVDDSMTRGLESRLERAGENSATPHLHVYEGNVNAFLAENRGRIISALAAIATVPHSLPPGTRFPVWFNEVAAPVMALTGDKALLDQWRQPSVATGGEGFGDLLERLWQMRQARSDAPFLGFLASEIADDESALTAAATFCAGITTDMLKGAHPDLDWLAKLPLQEQKPVLKARAAARGKAAGFIGRKLQGRNGHVGGTLRLAVVKTTGKDRHSRLVFDVQPAFKPKGEWGGSQ
jgi:hypothetical protein